MRLKFIIIIGLKIKRVENWKLQKKHAKNDLAIIIENYNNQQYENNYQNYENENYQSNLGNSKN